MSHQHQEQYVPYDYDEYQGFSPLGAQALMGEQSALESAESLPVKIGAFTKAYVEHDSSNTEVAAAEKLAGPLRWSADVDQELYGLERDVRNEMMAQRMDEAKMKETLDDVRGQLVALDTYEKAVVESNFTGALTDDPKDKPTLLNFTRWKEASDSGNTLSWVEWLSATPDAGGATDEQLRNVLQWNEYKYQEINQKDAERLRLHEWAFEQGLNQAVKAGEIDQALLDNYVDQPKPAVHIADPLNLRIVGANGFIHSDESAGLVHGRSIVLKQHWESKTFVHERTHILGRFGADDLFNEAATDKIAGKIFDDSPLATITTYDKSYDSEEKILDVFMGNVGMNDREMSKLFAERNGTRFVERLNAGAKTGDILGDLKVIKEVATELNQKHGFPTTGESLARTMALVAAHEN